MEVLNSSSSGSSSHHHQANANHNHTHNTTPSNNNNNEDDHYLRSSSLLSLVSAHSEGEFSSASFHSCYEPHDHHHETASTPGNNSNTSMPYPQRVPSYACLLEDVMEETDSVGMDLTVTEDDDERKVSPALLQQHHFLVPLQSSAKPRELTAARLALSSDVGMLFRSNNNNSNTGDNKKQQQQARPMSRSFATPRAAVGTVVRPSLSTTSLHSMYSATSFCSMKELGLDEDNDDDDGMPCLCTEHNDDNDTDNDDQVMMDMDLFDTTTKAPTPSRRRILVRTPTACLADMMDDVQIHILQFLPLRDIRSLMATKKQFRKLLFTKDAHVLWKEWYHKKVMPSVTNPNTLSSSSSSSSSLNHPLFQTNHDETVMISANNNNNNNNNSNWEEEVLLVDDLSLPTAARPSSLLLDNNNNNTNTSSTTELSHWHHQANLSLLLSMVQAQPTDIDQEQLSEYTTWQGRGRSSTTNRRRLRTTTTAARNNNNNNTTAQLQCRYSHVYQRQVVQFTGRVGQGDRCVRSQRPLPRPTLMTSKDAYWVLPPNGLVVGNDRHSSNSSNKRDSHKRNSSGSTVSLLDLFCRKGRAVSASRAAWRPFVAPFVSSSSLSSSSSSSSSFHDTTKMTAIHLTPRFVSYFEVSILEPKTDDSATTLDNHNTNSNTSAQGGSADCVAVGLATESFDWHARMPGWDASSYGYHGDDGGIFHSSGGMLRKFGPSYGRGDVVGCGVDHVAGGIFFTLNGQFLGYAWTGLPDELLQKDLYPIVGVDTNDFVHCNFGTEPFAYNLKFMIVRHEDLVHQSLAASARASSS